MHIAVEIRRTKASKKTIVVRIPAGAAIPASGSKVHLIYRRQPIAVTIDGDPQVGEREIELKAVAKSGAAFDKVAGE